MNKKKISEDPLDALVFHPKLGIVTVREVVEWLKKEKIRKEREIWRSYIDERKMLFLSCKWFRDIYGKSVYFYSPARKFFPDVWGIKEKRADFYEMKASYMKWNKGKLHDVPMQNIQYEYHFLRAYKQRKLKMPEETEKYTFNFLILPEVYKRVKTTYVSLIKRDLCESFVKELGYGIYILHSADDIEKVISPTVFVLSEDNAENRLKILSVYIRVINQLKS